jgi:CYTH domain-containing protein
MAGMVPTGSGKYARVERERRFLLTAAPPGPPTGVRRITDRYLAGTRLRLRSVERSGAAPELKLTQKIPADRPGPVQGLITTTYLSPAEYEVLAVLPAALLRKTRYSLPPLGVDVFEPPLHGLVLAEAEFGSDASAQAFPVPPLAVAEVTDDPRFTGGRLAVTARGDLLRRLAEYGIRVVE